MTPSKEFLEAVHQHHLMLAIHGEAHPATLSALAAVMLLAPPEVFQALEELSAATIH